MKKLTYAILIVMATITLTSCDGCKMPWSDDDPPTADTTAPAPASPPPAATPTVTPTPKTETELLKGMREYDYGDELLQYLLENPTLNKDSVRLRLCKMDLIHLTSFDDNETFEEYAAVYPYDMYMATVLCKVNYQNEPEFTRVKRFNFAVGPTHVDKDYWNDCLVTSKMPHHFWVEKKDDDE